MAKAKEEVKKVVTKAVAKRNPGNPAPRRRRRQGFTLPIAVLAGFVPGLIKTWEHWQMCGMSCAAREAGRIYTGIDFWEGKFNFQWMMHGTLPIIAGILIHRFVGGGFLGVNRALARAGVPFIRL